MNFLCLVGRCRLTRADGPNGFISDDDASRFFALHRRQTIDELPQNDVERLAAFAFSQRFANADDGHDIVIECGANATRNAFICFSKKLAALTVADNRMRTTHVFEHIGTDFARIGALGGV